MCYTLHETKTGEPVVATYAFVCEACGKEFDVSRPMSQREELDRTLPACPACGSALEIDSSQRDGAEIMEGELVCAAGAHRYSRRGDRRH